MKKSVKTTALILLVAAACLVPLATTNNYSRMLFNQTLVNILVVLGLNFITGLTGQMNLGMAGIFGIGAYTSALMATRLHASPWLGLLGAAFAGLLLGVALGYPSLRVKGIYLALTTIGFGEIVRLLLTNLADLTGGTQGVLNIPSYKIFGISLAKPQHLYYLLLLILIIGIMTAQRVIRSKWGRAFKAIRDNESAVESCGINIAEIKITAFIFSAVYTCIAGALYAHLMAYINPTDFTFDMSVKYLMMLMLGGIGSVPGNIIGGIVITLLPEYLRFLKDYYWLVFSVIVLMCVIVLPHGLISLFQKSTGKKRIQVKGGN